METPESIREKALRDIKAVHTRWYHGEGMTATEAVVEMEAIAVSVWQRESIAKDKEAENGNA
jgi:hypothetical protein